MYRLEIDRIINAPPQVVWEVISDIESYADYAGNLSKAIKTSEGAKPNRRCWDIQGRSWDETCVLWKEGEVYSYVVDTSPPDYPYPFKHLQGTWGMEVTPQGVRVYMIFEYIPKPPLIFGWFVHLMVKRQFTPTVNDLMDNWEAEIIARVQSKVA